MRIPEVPDLMEEYVTEMERIVYDALAKGERPDMAEVVKQVVRTVDARYGIDADEINRKSGKSWPKVKP